MKEEEEALLRELQEEKENKQKVPVIRPFFVLTFVFSLDY
jgi:hypothetical protein